MRRAYKIGMLTASLTCALCIGGVAATWTYSSQKSASSSTTVTVSMGDFFSWSGASTLPTTEGYNQYELIERIIDALNGTLDGKDYTTLLENMESRANGNILGLGTHLYYGSMDEQQTSAADIMTENTENLSFIVEYNSSYSEITIYTTSVYLGEGGTSDTCGINYHYNTSLGNPTIPYGDYIYCIYKTTLSNASGEWAATSTTEGKATMCWYDENRSLTPQAKQIPSFDTSSWVATSSSPIGDSLDNAIWTFDGDIPIAALDSSNSVVYYKMVPENTITRSYSVREGNPNSLFGMSTTTVNYNEYYMWNAEGTYTLATTAYNTAITLYVGDTETPDGTEAEFASMTRESSAVTTTDISGTTTVTTTVTDTVVNEDGTKTVTMYTVKDVTAGETTTTTVTQVVSTYASASATTPESTSAEVTISALPALSINYTATTGNYYYFKVEGTTDIPLTLDLVV